MSEEKKAVALNENTLEGIAGGGFNGPVPPMPCPCGTFISPLIGFERVQCPNCGRWYRVDGMKLTEETQGGSTPRVEQL